MKFPIVAVITLTLSAAAAVPARAAVPVRSKTLRVETPANNPQLAVNKAQDLYLQKTGDGKTLLYVEEQNGRGLAVLDVTSPSNIRRIADATLTAASAFDFVHPVGDSSALIRYRDGSGYALLNLARDRRPFVENGPAIAPAADFESLGQTGLLEPVAANADALVNAGQTYDVLATVKNGAPAVLATVSNVTRQASNGDTGTVFLLNPRGVTVVRRLRVEQTHEAELIAEEHN